MSHTSSLLLNGGSDELIGAFDLNSGKVSGDDFADVLTARSVESVPAFIATTTEPVKTTYQPALSVDATQPDATVATQQDKGILDYLGGIAGNIWDSIKTTAEATVRGAIEGGTAASSGAAAGAQVGAQTVNIGTTQLLFGALILILLLRR